MISKPTTLAERLQLAAANERAKQIEDAQSLLILAKCYRAAINEGSYVEALGIAQEMANATMAVRMHISDRARQEILDRAPRA